MFNFHLEKIEELAVILVDRIVAALLLSNYFNASDTVDRRATTYKNMLKKIERISYDD